MKTKAKSKPSLAKTKSDSTIIKRLAAWYDAATPEQIKAGKEWYDEARAFSRYLAARYSVTDTAAATVLSALSPGVNWTRNKIDAENLIATYVDGKPIDAVTVSTYGQNKRKAWEALATGFRIESQSPKTFSFVTNICGNLQPVTVDRWHARACLYGPGKKRQVSESIPLAQYRRVEQLTQRLARKLSLPPAIFQAIIWVTIRES